MNHPILRVARPTDDLPALRRFYCDGLGLRQIASFTAHNGFDGLMLGHPNAPYHLEFTHQPGHRVGRVPTADNLLVFYLPDATEWQAAVQRMEAAGYAPVPSYNLYWDVRGRTFEDPDGYRVVLQRAAWAPQAASAAVTLRDFRPGDQPVFRQLNEEWISHYFTLEPADLKALDHPEKYILAPGGAILFAELDGQVVGTCAIIKMPTGSYELAKMAVSPAAQGRQIGYQLGQAAVQRVRELGGCRVYLESNARLAPALALYRKLGFEDLAEPNPSPYARADVQMELLLR